MAYSRGVLVIAVDTSTSAIGVALHDGTSVVDAVHEVNPMGHAEFLAPAMQQVMRQAGVTGEQISHVVVGRGPGPFTGLRVGIATGSCAALAWGVPVRGVCSLEAMAQQVWAEQGARDVDLLVATDARRKEVYWATYRLGEHGIVEVSAPKVGAAADIPAHVRALPQVGRGARLYLAGAGPHLGVEDVHAGWLADRAVAVLNAGTDLSDISPLYLRRPDAAEQKSRSVIPHELRVG